MAGIILITEDMNKKLVSGLLKINFVKMLFWVNIKQMKGWLMILDIDNVLFVILCHGPFVAIN